MQPGALLHSCLTIWFLRPPLACPLPGLWACPCCSNLDPDPGPSGPSKPLPTVSRPWGDPALGRAAAAGSRKAACVSLAKQNGPGLRAESLHLQSCLLRLGRLGSMWRLEGGHHRHAAPRSCQAKGAHPGSRVCPGREIRQHEERQRFLRAKGPGHRVTGVRRLVLSVQSAPPSPLSRLPPHSWQGRPCAGHWVDLPVSCLMPKESPAAVATSGARRRRGQVRPLLGLSQASGEPVGPGTSRAGDRGGTRVGRRGPGPPRGVAL